MEVTTEAPPCILRLAHELRNPINNLVGETEVALSRARDAEHYHGVLESNLEEYQRLSRMIDSLLFLGRADDPQTRIETIQLDTRKEILPDHATTPCPTM